MRGIPVLVRDIGIIVRIYLSAFSLAKIIRLAKKVSLGTLQSIYESSTKPFTAIHGSVDLSERVKDLLTRYVPSVSTIPLTQGMTPGTLPGKPHPLNSNQSDMGLGRSTLQRAFFSAFPFEVSAFFQQMKDCPYPGVRDFLEWSLYQGWMRQYLKYPHWYCAVALDQAVSLEAFVDPPVYCRTWYTPKVDKSTFRFCVMFQVYDWVVELSRLYLHPWPSLVNLLWLGLITS